jgi:hypothetical protein
VRIWYRGMGGGSYPFGRREKGYRDAPFAELRTLSPGRAMAVLPDAIFCAYNRGARIVRTGSLSVVARRCNTCDRMFDR